MAKSAARSYSDYYKNNTSTPGRRVPENDDDEEMPARPGSMPRGKVTKPGMSVPKDPKKLAIAEARKKALQRRLGRKS